MIAKLMVVWTEAYGEKIARFILQKYLESGEEKITDNNIS